MSALLNGQKSFETLNRRDNWEDSKDLVRVDEGTNSQLGAFDGAKDDQTIWAHVTSNKLLAHEAFGVHESGEDTQPVTQLC